MSNHDLRHIEREQRKLRIELRLIELEERTDVIKAMRTEAEDDPEQESSLRDTGLQTPSTIVLDMPIRAQLIDGANDTHIEETIPTIQMMAARSKVIEEEVDEMIREAALNAQNSQKRPRQPKSEPDTTPNMAHLNSPLLKRPKYEHDPHRAQSMGYPPTGTALIRYSNPPRTPIQMNKMEIGRSELRKVRAYIGGSKPGSQLISLHELKVPIDLVNRIRNDLGMMWQTNIAWDEPSDKFDRICVRTRCGNFRDWGFNHDVGPFQVCPRCLATKKPCLQIIKGVSGIILMPRPWNDRVGVTVYEGGYWTPQN